MEGCIAVANVSTANAPYSSSTASSAVSERPGCKYRSTQLYVIGGKEEEREREREKGRGQWRVREMGETRKGK